MILSFLSSVLFFSSLASADEKPTLPGAGLAKAGTYTTAGTFVVWFLDGYQYQVTETSAFPVIALMPPTGVALAHYGNKKMLAAMNGKVDDKAYNWGKRLSTISLATGVVGLGAGSVIFLGSSVDESGNLGAIATSFSLLATSYVTMLSASVFYEVQRRKTVKAFRSIDGSSLDLDSPENHFSVTFVPSLNGLSLTGTF